MVGWSVSSRVLSVDGDVVLAEDVETGEVAVGHRLPIRQTDG
jgi:hypothetical protein